MKNVCFVLATLGAAALVGCTEASAPSALPGSATGGIANATGGPPAVTAGRAAGATAGPAPLAGTAATGSMLLDAGGGAQPAIPPVAFDTAVTPTFTEIYDGILQPTCGGTFCHLGLLGATAPISSPLDFTSRDAAYAALNGVIAVGCDGQRVSAGDADASVLMVKLTSEDCAGTRMPVLATGASGAALPADQIEAIGAWIAAGAADN